MNRFHSILVAFAIALSAPAAALAAPRLSVEAEARGVTVVFFRSINERRYEQTCRLLSKAYYKKYRIPSRRHCVAGLRISFMWSQAIRFRITEVEAEQDWAVVSATADGAPGRVVLVRERGAFKVLELEGM